MGADMLVGIVAHKKNAKIDFDAGRAFVKKLRIGDLDLDELIAQGLDESDEEFFDENGNVVLEGVLGWLDNSVSEFSEALYCRRVTSLDIRDLTVFITGGLSWGDINEEASLFWRVGSVPGLLEAMGFVGDWYQEEQREVTPDEEAAAIDSIKRVGSS